MRYGFVLILFLLHGVLSAAPDNMVSGYIADAKTGETLIGVNVVVRGQQRGAASDNNGYFRLPGLPRGVYTLEISYIGYETKYIEITLAAKSIVLDEILMQPSPLSAEEIVVTAKRSELADRGIETSALEISREAVRNIPGGDKDLFRSLKYLPGIEGIDPFSPLYSVRGGDPGENLVLLDGVTIYNPYHFVTASGLFNAAALKKAEMLVGGFGAEYGGRNSSVLYITTREGNNEALHGEIEPSTTQTRAVMDFPVGPDATMMISGRYYYNLVTRFLLDMPSYFYDTNISLNWKLNDYNRLKIRLFLSHDRLDYSFSRFSHYFRSMLDEEDRDIFDNYDIVYQNVWHNYAASLSLTTIITPALYLQTQLSASFFTANNRTRFDLEVEDEENKETVKLDYTTKINSEIRDLSIRSSLNFKPDSRHLIKIGAEISSYAFANDISINIPHEGRVTSRPTLLAGFLEDKITLGPLALRPGLRFSRFSYFDKWYREPRINAVMNLPYDLKLKMAWGEYYQYIISLNSQEYELSQFLDYYYPLQERKPSMSTHYIAGVERSFRDLRIALDLYYKDIKRTYTFDYTASEADVYLFASKLKPGSGRSYGLEFLITGKWDHFSGWMSYTLSRSERSYAHIMQGKSFLYDYDRTHTLKVVSTYHVNPALSYSATLRVLSGVPKTLESGGKSYYYYNPQTGDYAYYPTYISDVKNNVRMPCFIRLDLGLKKKLRKGLGAELAKFLSAKESYFNFTLGNVLFFLHRNVIWYFPYLLEGELYGLGSNYLPEFSAGYTLKF